jgi:hypothetical protein
MPPKRKTLKGGSTASDFVTKHIPDAAFEQMNRAFTNDFAISGGARRKKAAPKIDMNASPTVKMVIRNKNGGAATTNAFLAEIGKSTMPLHNVPEILPSSTSNGMFSRITNWNSGTQSVPYPQLELASRDMTAMRTVGGASKPKAKSKAKAKTPSKTPAKSKH